MFNVPCKLCRSMITQESQQRSIKGNVTTVAQMINARQFTYGFSGMYLFKTDLGLREGDSVCNDCLLSNKENIEAAKTVLCTQCGEFFQPVFGDDNQAWGCCSSVREKNGQLKVCCGFGSNYDCTVFDVLPVVKVGDKICDKCIQLFIDEGTFVENREESGIKQRGIESLADCLPSKQV